MSVTLLLDSNAVADVIRFGDTTVRTPDWIDPVFETAVWIGEHGCVEVPTSMLADVPRLARGAHHPIGRGKPRTFGIRVGLHDPNFVSPAYVGWAKARELTQWVEFAEIVGAQTVDA